LHILFCSENSGQTLLMANDHLTVVCLVAWPLNGGEAGGDLVLIETSPLFLLEFLLISMRATSLA